MRAIQADADAGECAKPTRPTPKQPSRQQAAADAGDARAGRRAERRRYAGPFRKVGPSLRHLDSKVDYNWLYSWIRRRPISGRRRGCRSSSCTTSIWTTTTRTFTIHDAAGNEQKVTDREYTKRFENIEIRALAEFLLANSQPFEYIEPPQGITEAPSAERGKWLFESRGCLACHSHDEFPGITFEPRTRPVARRGQVQHGEGPALAL